MELIENIYFTIGAMLFTNFFYALLYLLSRTAGDWLSDEFSRYGGCLGALLFFPFLGLTNFSAMLIYDRFNWFVARLVMFLYAVLLFVLFFVLIMLVS